MGPAPDPFSSEEKFHDQWAATIDVKEIDVDIAFEGSTAPENRFILSHLGNVSGKYILDLGCGAGESSVYFARKGARCVAGDASPGMVQTARQLAEYYGVEIGKNMRYRFGENWIAVSPPFSSI